MNKEEAIKELTDLLPEEFLMDYAEAIEMGIEALEREECGDCISRKSVSGCVSTMYYKGLGKQKSLEYILKYIDRLPAVLPMPKMGKCVLDKIRAEIDGLTYYWCEVNPRSVIDDVLKIIDKYKAESEE